MIVKFPLLHFVAGHTESPLDFILVIGASMPKPAFQLVDTAGHDEDGNDFAP